MGALEKSEKLILGTAQFGLDYGVNNNIGQLSLNEIKLVLKRALESGVYTLDTATAYGNSEHQLGLALPKDTEFKLISKFPPQLPLDQLPSYLHSSLNKLNQNKLHGYLLHSYNTYREAPEAISILKELKTQGLIDKIGVSLYHPKEAEILLEANVPVDILQFPYNVFDRRFEFLLPRLKEANIETHVRSVFLQGLFFVQAESLPSYFKPIQAKILELQNLTKKFDIPLAAALLNYVIGNINISNVVIGIDSVKMLEENLSYCNIDVPIELIDELSNFEEEDEKIILPFNWPKL